MKTVNVVAAIIRKDGKVLATQRGYGEFKDSWEFPGGKIEPGETPEQSIVREIKEELDADIRVDSHLVDVSHDYDSFHLEMQCFVCELEHSGVTLLEHEAAAWLDFEGLYSVDWLPADIKVVDAIAENRII